MTFSGVFAKPSLIFGSLVLSVITLVILGGCNNTDIHNFGNDFISNLEPALTRDTTIYLEVISQPISDEQPFRVSTNYYAPIGRLNTPEFGEIMATSFIQFRPGLPFSFPTDIANLKIDSCFLLVKYASHEGDSNTSSDISVYEIIDDRFIANQDKNYNFDNNILIDRSKVLGHYTKSVIELLQDSGASYATYYSNVMRMPIDTAWSKKFITNDNTTGYANDSAFRSMFKGFAFVPSSTTADKVLMNFALSDTNTYFAVYYSYEDTENVGSRIVGVVKMPFSVSTCAFATDTKRDRKGSLAEAAMQSITNNKQVFLQSAPSASQLVLKIPDLRFLDTASINRAELLLEESDLPSSSHLTFIRPAQLYVDVLNTSTSTPTPFPVGLNNDYLYTFLPPTMDFGLLEGYYISSDATFRGYKLNVSRYIQLLVNPNKNYTPDYAFRVTAPYKILYNNSSSQTGSFSVGNNDHLALSGLYLHGQDATNPKSIRLRIVYLK